MTAAEIITKNSRMKYLFFLLTMLPSLLNAQPELPKEIQTQLAAGQTPVRTVELNKDRYYQSEGRIRDRIDLALDELIFDADNELVVQLYRLADDPAGVAKEGSPSMIVLDKMLRFSQYKRWELVVYDPDPERLAAKIATLQVAATGKFAERTDGRYEKTRLSILPYQEKTHGRVHWDCVSERTGMYMRALR